MILPVGSVCVSHHPESNLVVKSKKYHLGFSPKIHHFPLFASVSSSVPGNSKSIYLKGLVPKVNKLLYVTFIIVSGINEYLLHIASAILLFLLIESHR